MLAYALAFKPCSEATDIGSILSWGSVFWRDLVGLQRHERIWGFYGVPVGGEEAAVQASSVFSQAQIRKKLLLVHPIPFFTFFLARLNKIIYHFGL